MRPCFLPPRDAFPACGTRCVLPQNSHLGFIHLYPSPPPGPFSIPFPQRPVSAAAVRTAGQRRRKPTPRQARMVDSDNKAGVFCLERMDEAGDGGMAFLEEAGAGRWRGTVLGVRFGAR